MVTGSSQAGQQPPGPMRFMKVPQLVAALLAEGAVAAAAAFIDGDRPPWAGLGDAMAAWCGVAAASVGELPGRRPRSRTCAAGRGEGSWQTGQVIVTPS